MICCSSGEHRGVGCLAISAMFLTHATFPFGPRQFDQLYFTPQYDKNYMRESLVVINKDINYLVITIISYNLFTSH